VNQVVPIYVNNLARRPDRLHYMQAQLSQAGLQFERHAAFDVAGVCEEDLDPRIDRPRSRVFMSSESACNLASHLAMHQRLLHSGAEAAIIMEDDIELSPDIAPAARDLEWLPPDIGVIQFERYGSGQSRRLVGPSLGKPSPGRSLHRLFSRVGGSACYLITRRAARHLADWTGPLRAPIDHLLFSPNVSPVFGALGTAVVLPALARQEDQLFASDIAMARDRRKTDPWRHARRMYYEVNCIPWQITRMSRGARWVPFQYQRTVSSAPDG